ncbi:MAG: CpaF family protein [Chloroflexi bacterium]|nr:CpaF family protein [Chloroflexota bacterium]
MSLRNRLTQTNKESQPQPEAAAPPPPPQPAAITPRAELARPRPGDLSEDDYNRLKKWLLGKVAEGLDEHADLKRTPTTIQMLRDRFTLVYGQAKVSLPADAVEALFSAIVDEIVGFGPIEKLLNDPTITEVMVNGPKQVYIERAGKLLVSDVSFEDDDHVMRIVDRILWPLGRRVDRKLPMADARLPDGSRVNVIIPPSAIDGPVVTIRKFSAKKLTVEDLIAFGSMTSQIADFLRACVVSRLNIVVSGGTGSGKTTLLNVLSGMIPEDERVITLEDSAELQLGQPHVVRLEARPADPDGTGAVTIRELVKNSLRMRPERIVVGEIRGGEAIGRIETMSLMGGLEIPLKVIREQIAKAVDLIVQQARLTDGSRKITYVTEVSGMEGESVVTQDIFKYDETLGANGKPLGMKPTGLRPFFTPRLESHGFKLPPEIFGASAGDMLLHNRRR